MTVEVLALIVQSTSVAVGIGASIVALRIAARGRRAAAQQARLALLIAAAGELAGQTARFNVGVSGVEAQQQANARMFAPLATLGPTRMPKMWAAFFSEQTRPPNTDPVTGRALLISFDREARAALVEMTLEQDRLALTRRQRRALGRGEE